MLKGIVAAWEAFPEGLGLGMRLAHLSPDPLSIFSASGPVCRPVRVGGGLVPVCLGQAAPLVRRGVCHFHLSGSGFGVPSVGKRQRALCLGFLCLGVCRNGAFW